MDVRQALEVAAKVHRGQTDKAGEPYISHVQRVMALTTTSDEKIAAALHDVVEDTDLAMSDLAAMGCPARVLAALDALTRRADEGYEAFIARASSDPIARSVKVADLYDNSDEERLARLPQAEAASLRAKYGKAIEALGARDQIERWKALRSTDRPTPAVIEWPGAAAPRAGRSRHDRGPGAAPETDTGGLSTGPGDPR